MNDEVLHHLERSVSVEGSTVSLIDPDLLREQIDVVVHHAVFGEGVDRETARWVIWELGQALGIYPASIHELYIAIGRGDVATSFTVPAMNLRAMTFDTARAVFRAANRLNVGALILEIARSEMGYTDQRPAEYVSVLLAAAIKEGFQGPVFIQGDHFQVSAKNYAANPDKEVQAVKDLMDEAVAAGFYNIDIDTSTLVTLDPPTLDEQQKVNYELCAHFTQYVRGIEPEGVTISLGGEIGEVGGHNSTVEELHAFMQGYNRTLQDMGNLEGISKISVQTGTSHGGVVLPDGTLADVNVDFDTLKILSQAAREEYGLGGAVQHGASTLPPEAFNRFPDIGTVEIHLATGFQNLTFDNAAPDWVAKVYDYVRENFKGEWKSSQTEDQFLYSTRKKAIGPLKHEMWHFDDDTKGRIGSALEAQFAFLFEKLNVVNTRDVVKDIVTRVEQHRERPQIRKEEAALDIADDLAD